MYSIFTPKNVLEFSSQGYNSRLFTKMAWFDWMTGKNWNAEYAVLLEYILHTCVFCDFDIVDTYFKRDEYLCTFNQLLLISCHINYCLLD